MEAPAPPTTVAVPPKFWRLAERRSRKAGSPNIFRGVNLRQLQRLFRSSGDQDAEQRAQLVWGHEDETELAQALMGLRARSHRSRLRVDGARNVFGPRWLRAFGHLRISERSGSSLDDDDGQEDSETEPGAFGDPDGRGAAGSKAETSPADEPANSQCLQGSPVCSLWHRAGTLKQGGQRDPERYLHRILH